LETFFGAERGDSSSLIGSRGGVDKRLSDKYTLVRLGAKINEEMLSVDIALSISLSMLSRRGNILSIIARSFGKESSMKSTSQKLISFPGVSRSSRQYPFDSSVLYPSI